MGLSMKDRLMVFTGSAHPKLAAEIAELLHIQLGDSTTRFLPDSEIHVKINEVVRNKDIYLIQPCCPPVNDHVIELLLYVDAFRRASAKSVTAVIPYYPYARQDRMAKGREAISARVVANLLETCGVNRLIFIDIHNLAIQGFFNIPVDPLSAIPVLAEYFRTPKFNNAAIVSPDVGRATLAGKYAEYLNLPLVVMHKRRSDNEEVRTTHVVGDIRGRCPIIIDDMIASGSVLKQINALYEHGAVGNTYLSITHPILLPKALELLNEDMRIEKLVVTNTIPVPDNRVCDKIEVRSIGPLLAEIIKRIHLGISISDKLVLR